MTDFHGGGAFYFLPIFSHHISHRTTAMLAAIILTLFAVSLTIIVFSLYRVSYSPNAEKKPAQKKLPEPGSGSDSPEKKRKKRVKKKTQEATHSGGVDGKEKKQDLFPFTSSSSAIQRKISNHYEQLVKSYESSGLNLAEVGKFVNCLVDAKKELQHRSDVLQRKFIITRALLHKADRSSFDRLHKQIYKFELEKKRLDDDSFVYNWLQQQLKASPAYKRILEIVATIEMTDKLRGREEDGDNGDDFTNMSFEELLEQEKKDAFWQKHKKIRSN